MEPDGTIDPAKADAQWAAATDRNKVRTPESIEKGVEKARATIEADEKKPITQAQVQAVEEGSAVAENMEPQGTGGLSMAKAAAADKAYSAQLKKLRLDKEKGKLIDRKLATQQVYDLARKFRDSWMQLPARKAALMAADLGCDAHAMEQALDTMIRDHLAEMGEITIDLSQPEV
ncbi:elements of external origin [Celeribacter halophilus]|uniref:elements of external origin n=1 Tax=Celeribacter halophilus TaxID=576117 RepID=UPI0011146CE4|nr:elements of external origin [Celeribacter halophilus]